MKGLSIMAEAACHAVLVASVKEVCWPSGKQSLVCQRRTVKSDDGGTSPVDHWLKTPPSKAQGVGSIPGQGAKIPHALQPKIQNIKDKNIVINSTKTLKIAHIKFF